MFNLWITNSLPECNHAMSHLEFGNTTFYTQHYVSFLPVTWSLVEKCYDLPETPSIA